MKKILKKWLIVGGIVLVTLTVSVIIFVTGYKKNVVGMPGGGMAFAVGGDFPEIEISYVTVRSEVAAVAALKDYVLTNGEVESQSAIEIYPSMSGKVSRVNVMLGSHVEKGDIIAYVDPSEPGSNYAQSPITASISGSIVSSPLKVGAKVSNTTVFTMIGDIENLQVSALIPERYVSELKVGLKAEVSLEAYPGVVFNATVSRVSPVVDKASRTKEIILNFDKNDSRVNAGMFAKIKLYTSTYGGKIVIPKDSVVSDEEQNYIFVVNDDYSVSKRLVRLGKSVDSKVQVTDNLMAGERVVVEGMLSLSDGAKVSDIANPKTPETEEAKDDSALGEPKIKIKGKGKVKIKEGL